MGLSECSCGGLKMIKGIHHVQITIPTGKSEKAKEVYCGHLGLKEIPKPKVPIKNGGFWIQLREIQIHVGEEKGVNRQSTKAHICYEVIDLHGWRKKITELKLPISEGTAIPGIDRFEFRDPFGNRVELLQKLAPTTEDFFEE
jgi:catechol 2,3-dioxygenase-like lactoylglutathione lyase family enzyme